MTDARVLRLNEQLKGVAGIFFNLGAAAIGAVAARLVLRGEPDWVGAGWLFGAVVLIWLGLKLMSLMEADS